MTFTPDQLNLLQSEGIISDLCVNQDEIWWKDKIRAIEWLASLPVHSPTSGQFVPDLH